MGQNINELAQLFRERDNVKQIGTMVGTVVSTNPFSISIGKITLSGSRLIIADRLLDRIETVRMRNIENGTSEWSSYEIEYKDVLKKGDRVIVSPTQDQQTFVVDAKVGE